MIDKAVKIQSLVAECPVKRNYPVGMNVLKFATKVDAQIVRYLSNSSVDVDLLQEKYNVIRLDIQNNNSIAKQYAKRKKVVEFIFAIRNAVNSKISLDWRAINAN